MWDRLPLRDANDEAASLRVRLPHLVGIDAIRKVLRVQQFQRIPVEVAAGPLIVNFKENAISLARRLPIMGINSIFSFPWGVG